MIVEFEKDLPCLEIYVDGSCVPNPGRGGWGVVIFGDISSMTDDDVILLAGGESNSTNNRMEITAPIEALKILETKFNINIYTDSQYVQKGMCTWIHSWKKTGWKKGKLKNMDLWMVLDRVNRKHNVKWHWVRGHDGNLNNEKADKLASIGRRSSKRKSSI